MNDEDGLIQVVALVLLVILTAPISQLGFLALMLSACIIGLFELGVA